MTKVFFFLIMLKSQMTSTKAYTTVGLYISAKTIFFYGQNGIFTSERQLLCSIVTNSLVTSQILK